MITRKHARSPNGGTNVSKIQHVSSPMRRASPTTGKFRTNGALGGAMAALLDSTSTIGVSATCIATSHT